MPRAEWGTKHVCTACLVKFYDFNLFPSHCPRCGTAVTMKGDSPPPDAPDGDVVHDDDDADATLDTDDDVEENPEIEV